MISLGQEEMMRMHTVWRHGTDSVQCITHLHFSYFSFMSHETLKRPGGVCYY